MIVSITEFSTMAKDGEGRGMPLGQGRLACQVRTSAGAFTALNNATRLVRIATDTALRLDIGGGTTDTADELIPAGVEYFAVGGGVVLTIAAA